MPYLIDAHEDLAYNALTFGRDYRRSVAETRMLEADSVVEQVTGKSLLGWQEYQRGQVALVFGTIFIVPNRYKGGTYENQNFGDCQQAYRLTRMQVDYYQRLCDESPQQFQLVRSRADLQRVLLPWEKKPADVPEVTHPVGIILSMEGAEGLTGLEELEEWQQAGLRLVGPVWAGTRYCGGTYEGDKFTHEGVQLLETMAEMGYTLDIAHMTEQAALQALDIFPGIIIASHCNASALLHDDRSKRRLISDRVLRRLCERDGVVGVVPYNRFLLPGWTPADPREDVSLKLLIDHIDHICQVTGSSQYVAIGTDFDGGFGWPAVPNEINTIADIQKLSPLLEKHGFTSTDIKAVFNSNWTRLLEKTLPE